MKKFLLFMALLFFILVALMEIVLPKSLSNVLSAQISNLTGAQSIDLNLSSSPNVKIAAGYIDKIHAVANEGRLGEVDFKTLTLDGENISVDVLEVLFPTENLSSQERTNKILKSADKIELHGIVTTEDLKSFIEKKVDKLDNAEINISPEGISATGQVKIMGRMADVEMAGNFFESDGNIYFHGTDLHVKSSLLRHVQLDRFFGDIKILDADNLPLNLKYNSVELRDNEILISAKKQ